MEEILNNIAHRKLFFTVSTLLAVLCLVLRYSVLPQWNSSLSRHGTEVFAQLAEGLFTTLTTTIFVGIFILWVTPSKMRRANFEPVESTQIRVLLKDAATKSLTWTLKGGMGRYTREETLSTLISSAKNTGTRRKIRIMLLILITKNFAIAIRYIETE